MHINFLQWVEEKKVQLKTLAINTDQINVATNNTNPSVTVDHSSPCCLGRVSVWQSGLMDVEILHFETEKRLMYEHYQLNGTPDFDKLLEKYFKIMKIGDGQN